MAKWIMLLYFCAYCSKNLAAQLVPATLPSIKTSLDWGKDSIQVIDSGLLNTRGPYVLFEMAKWLPNTLSNKTGDQIEFRHNLHFRKLHFGYTPGGLGEHDARNFFLSTPSAFYMSDCTSDSLPIVLKSFRLRNMTGIMDISNIQAPALYFDSVSAGILLISNVAGALRLHKVGVEDLVIYQAIKFPIQNKFYNDVEISQSTLEKPLLHIPGGRLLFEEDTLSQGIDLSPTIDERPTTYESVLFRKCLLDRGIALESGSGDTVRIKRLAFISCQLGSNFQLTDFFADTVIFYNCGKLPSCIFDLLHGDRPTKIFLHNTTFDVGNFNYTSNTQLIFPPSIPDVPAYSITPDFISNTYESLIDKYVSENRHLTAETIDVQYRQWKADNGSIFAKIGYGFEKIWWYFGYRKFYIIIWTLFFLILFTLLNAIWWQDMNDTYPLTPAYSSRWQMRVTSVLLFTTYIFFSLRVDFTKLKFKKTRFVLLFFCQYIIGLGCLFFIFNAILKI